MKNDPHVLTLGSVNFDFDCITSSRSKSADPLFDDRVIARLHIQLQALAVGTTPGAYMTRVVLSISFSGFDDPVLEPGGKASIADNVCTEIFDLCCLDDLCCLSRRILGNCGKPTPECKRHCDRACDWPSSAAATKSLRVLQWWT